MNHFRASASLPHRAARAILLALTLALLAGCASAPARNPHDPFESYNRSMTRFNDDVDGLLLKPVATVYKSATPALVRTGLSNFFNNLADAWSFVNSALQLKPQPAMESLMRFNINTVFGLWGVLDIAGEMNIERHREDFGQTLGRWGVPAGPYLVLPILGPSTVRDTLALGVDTPGGLVSTLRHVPTRNSLQALRLLEVRSSLIRAGNVLDEAALDKYSFTRDVFLQRRRSQILDGNLPAEESPY